MVEGDYVRQAERAKRPVLALLLIGSGTLVWYFVGPLKRNAVSLISDVLLTFVCSLGLVGIFCRHLHVAIPIDPLEWQVSSDAANALAACLANTIGAAEGVLRVAASGSDSKLFTKVVIVLCLTSAIGRAASGATVTYAVIWFMFIIALALGKLSSDSTRSSKFLHKKLNIMGSFNTPVSSPRATFD